MSPRKPQATKNSRQARSALAGSLLESLDDTVDASAEEEWHQEIARRIGELDSGKVKPIPWAEARRQVSAILNDH
jgi:putative addiction module component (TIGR02574 family)